MIVLGEHSRAFKEIFNLAQGRLRDVFGMELRELPIREKVTLQERRQGNATSFPFCPKLLIYGDLRLMLITRQP